MTSSNNTKREGTPSQRAASDKPVRRSSGSVKVAKVPKKRGVSSGGASRAGARGESSSRLDGFKSGLKGVPVPKILQSAKDGLSDEPRSSRKTRGTQNENDRKARGGFLRGVASHYKVIVAVVLLLVFAFLSIYFPARDYYVAKRQNERLQHEYQLNLAHNEKIKKEVENLKTREGIEDHARKDLGMVMPGENSVNVVGVTEQPDAEEESVARRIERGSGTAEVTWVTKFLDFFFGVGDTSKSPKYEME